MTHNSHHVFLFCSGFFRRFAGYGVALMLVVQLLFPSLGKAEAPATWIEICSEFGAIQVQISLDEDEHQDKDCPDCDKCLMCIAQNGQSRSNPAAFATIVLATAGTGQMHPNAEASNPAQFWHDGRGPPRLTTYNMKRACGASMATTQFKREAS